MLYIWPYFVFFSFPLMLPSTVRLAMDVLSRLPGLRPQSKGTRNNMPRLWTFAMFTALAATIVRFNTIVHPFTLADNRHYVFYVFRILLRNSLTKYGAAPIYIICAYLSITTLGDPQIPESQPNRTKFTKDKPVDAKRLSEKGRGCRISSVLVWLASTTLSLATAPLVEPRYFIIPWTVWRLHVPPLDSKSLSVGDQRKQARGNRGSTAQSGWIHAIRNHDYRLWLETLWSLAINAVTGYMFLCRGFSWPQEPGNVQRFLW